MVAYVLDEDGNVTTTMKSSIDVSEYATETTESTEDTVTVDTYAIKILKYDVEFANAPSTGGVGTRMYRIGGAPYNGHILHSSYRSAPACTGSAAPA